VVDVEGTGLISDAESIMIGVVIVVVIIVVVVLLYLFVLKKKLSNKQEPDEVEPVEHKDEDEVF
jgi:flagellar basal body-associated protein FliL